MAESTKRQMEFIDQHKDRLRDFTYNTRTLFSGSFSEIPVVYFFSKTTDIDFMRYNVNLCAVPKHAQAPHNFKGEVLTIEPQNDFPGYVTLKNSKNECYKHLQTYDYDNPHGPALQTPAGWSITYDEVYSVQCPYWPSEAQEWKTRKRSHGWPSKQLIDEIVREGCLLVGKTHPNFKDGDNIQWRYSFSKAEMMLVSSWTDSQKYVYHVLRMIKSEFLTRGDDGKKTGICTYYLKTQMFWACEEKPVEFWEDGNLMTSICLLLTEIEKHLIDRTFPNYFLPECNIVEGVLIDNNFSDALRQLTNEIDRGQVPTLPPKICHECRISVSLPANIASYIHLWAERFGLPFNARRSKHEKVQELIDEELDELMKGIYNMQLARTSGDCHYTAAEQHFLNGMANEETVSRKRVTLSNSASLDAITACYQSLESAELSTLQDGQNQWDMSVAISCTKDHSPYVAMSRNLPWEEEKYGKFYEKYMNPTHLLSAAYLSNLYFITGKFKKCIETVEEQHSLASNAFQSELFPMIFCPQLASLFDENLQEVLGHLFGGKGIFEFVSCPHLFMYYIRIQSALGLREDYSYWEKLFNEHRAICKFHYYLDPCHHVLFETAWGNNVRRKTVV